ncbi:MAG: hypothetical protein KY469_16735 [Actinobacteria bacterium]|nr:hypothetical protein [Actinomycetota bacterium]
MRKGTQRTIFIRSILVLLILLLVGLAVGFVGPVPVRTAVVVWSQAAFIWWFIFAALFSKKAADEITGRHPVSVLVVAAVVFFLFPLSLAAWPGARSPLAD